MDPRTLAQLSAEERAFLHDLATPLATMTLILDVLGESTQAKLNETELQKLQQLKKLVERLSTSLRARRELIMQRNAAASPGPK